MKKSAFLCIDPQKDFCPGGALAVTEGDTIIPLLNDISKKINKSGGICILTQDFHPENHLSFASAHQDKNPFDPIEGIPGIGPVLWPDHCVMGTDGVEFHPDLNTNLFQAIIRKGSNKTIDSYSGFYDNNRQQSTGLAGMIRELEVNIVYIAGLAYDYCVKFTAIDAIKENFDTFVIEDATKCVNPDTLEENRKELQSYGIQIIVSKNIL